MRPACNLSFLALLRVPAATRHRRWPPWHQRLLATVLLGALALAPGYAQTRFEGEGKVVAVDAAQGMVTLNHGPIQGLMPAMQMAFPVQQVALLQGLHVGETVRFALQVRGAEWVITT